jgi:hypothetical protein
MQQSFSSSMDSPRPLEYIDWGKVRPLKWAPHHRSRDAAVVLLAPDITFDPTTQKHRRSIHTYYYVACCVTGTPSQCSHFNTINSKNACCVTVALSQCSHFIPSCQRMLVASQCSHLILSSQRMLVASQEHRRSVHINAEQNRRHSIKHGFELLRSLVPSLSRSLFKLTSKLGSWAKVSSKNP